MKRIILCVLSLIALCGTASADNSRVISTDKLPAEAKKFIKTHFEKDKVLIVTEENVMMFKEYEVHFENGTEVTFDGTGKWKEVECRVGEVKSTIVPAKIAAFVKERFPERQIKEIDRDSREYEVKLSGGTELTFDLKFNLVDYDD